MREKIASVQINCMRDMETVEREIGRIMGCERRRCSLVQSQDFLKLRLCALYGRGGCKAPISIFKGDMQVSLDDKKTISIYLLTSDVAANELVPTGTKRAAACENSDDFEEDDKSDAY